MNLWTSKGARAFSTLGCTGWRILPKQAPESKEAEGKEGKAVAILFISESTLLSAHGVLGHRKVSNWPLLQPRYMLSPAVQPLY